MEIDNDTEYQLKLQLVELAGSRVIHKDVFIPREEPV